MSVLSEQLRSANYKPENCIVTNCGGQVRPHKSGDTIAITFTDRNGGEASMRWSLEDMQRVDATLGHLAVAILKEQMQ